ncbi:MAG: Bro-N domain-containing protein [Alphaproteobacteria bacterium]|nr:Bro-N domain-containing protein [Alphaproteobacteria bacterium]
MTNKTENKALATFEGKKVRKIWHDEKWYFSIIDIVGILTESTEPRRYWSDLKRKLTEESENEELYEKIVQLKMISSDGKKYKTDAADTETLFRIIQSIPSPKAEPIKLWLARVGYERIQEYEDPSLAIDRAKEYYKKHGRTEEWIQQRILGQTTRNELTNYWNGHEIKEGIEYAILTDIIHKGWTDMTVKQHKDLKNLKNQNLRDHMTTPELVFTALAEISTKQVAEHDNATGLKENKIAAKEGGHIAKKAREELEARTGTKVISSSNFLDQNKPKKIE